MKPGSLKNEDKPPKRHILTPMEKDALLSRFVGAVEVLAHSAALEAAAAVKSSADSELVMSEIGRFLEEVVIPLIAAEHPEFKKAAAPAVS